MLAKKFLGHATWSRTVKSFNDVAEANDSLVTSGSQFRLVHL